MNFYRHCNRAKLSQYFLALVKMTENANFTISLSRNDAVDFVYSDEALNELEKFAPRQAKVSEMRFRLFTTKFHQLRQKYDISKVKAENSASITSVLIRFLTARSLQKVFRNGFAKNIETINHGERNRFAHRR